MKALQFNVNVPQFVAAKTLRTFFGNQVFYKGPVKTVQLADVSEPKLFTPDWVKIKTLYCGFCGSDMNLILLNGSPTASPFTSFPCVLGHEIVGEIIEAGASVQGFQNGDIVAVNPGLTCETRGIDPICGPCSAGRSSNCENFAEGSLPPGMLLGTNSGVNGGFAPTLSAHKSQLYKVPEGLSLESAVMTEPVAVALQTIFDNMPKEDDTVLVIGGGVIGNLTIQSIKALVPKCSVSVIEPSSFAEDMAKKAGADEVIPAKDIFKRTARITGAKVYKPMLGMEIPMGGFNRIYDTVGHSSTLNLSMRLMAAMGTLSVVGIGGDVKLDLTPLWLKLQTVQGVYAYGHVVFNGKKQHVFEIALDLMKNRKIQADTLVTHKFGIEDYEQMIEVNLNKQKHRAMKTVIKF
ncbi:MAG: alcohol dehydrogenase catalytic domain-containing protein [Desulfobacteraceae bacterium]|nr:alcohol dehydrogenase catalytic domain-containing protein [Desulfobacteraceae bacterium]MBC2754299.1 alcohol dehydrogenase catalytic domain-containing protein [Desulfobacteraceae bacterium]